MNQWCVVILFAYFVVSTGRAPFRPAEKSVPFITYFTSRYRGLCVGSLIAKTVVITAAICVIDPLHVAFDTRPINVIIGSSYRHPRRGIRVQVTKILIPSRINTTDVDTKARMLERSVAVLLLKRIVPSAYLEVPVKPINIDIRGTEEVKVHDDCFIPGWHFFYKGDKILPVRKFLLQRNLRVQFMKRVKKHTWCDALVLKYEKALQEFDPDEDMDEDSYICMKDGDSVAQPCHGMYGAPLVCRGRLVGMMTAPDAQWTNCTGHSNLFHLFNAYFLKNFLECIRILVPKGITYNWNQMKSLIYDTDHDEYDYLEEIYDHMLPSSTEDN